MQHKTQHTAPVIWPVCCCSQPFYPWPAMWLLSDITKLHSYYLTRVYEVEETLRNAECTEAMAQSAESNDKKYMGKQLQCIVVLFVCVEQYKSTESHFNKTVLFWRLQPSLTIFWVNHSPGQIVNSARTEVQLDNKKPGVTGGGRHALKGEPTLLWNSFVCIIIDKIKPELNAPLSHSVCVSYFNL